MNYKKIIEEIFSQVMGIEDPGHLPTYIPEIAQVDSSKFGVYISSLNGDSFGIGDFQSKFSAQSITKVLSLSLAYKLVGGAIWSRIGVEPSGTSFNSLIQLETDSGIPRNPFINAGALVICDILVSHLDNAKSEFLSFIHNISGNTTINYSERIAKSEKSIGFRNMALCNFIKSFGNIVNTPEDVLDFYFDLCSLELTCLEMSDLFLFLANNGRSIIKDKKIISTSQCRRINALMLTCGFYDESGEFAFKIGLPGKSGVGGGIVAILPGEFAISVWSPKLNNKGNSYKGLKFLEAFTTQTGVSIF